MAQRGKRGAVAVAAWTLLIAGCGGGGETPPPAQVGAKLQIAATAGSADALPSGQLQSQTVELRNAGDASARQVVVAVKPGAEALQLPLVCEGPLAARCTSRADGAIEIAELPAGGSVTLRQRLRIQAGHSGAVGNDWAVASADAAVAAGLQQSLKAYSFDLGLQHEPVAISGEGAARKLTYTLVLTNAGPDEARDVDWTLVGALDMARKGTTCTSGGGAVCPAEPGETMRIAKLPKGGTLRVVAEYGGGPAEGMFRDSEFMVSEVRAAGDSQAANDRLFIKQSAGLWGHDGHFDLVDLNGHSYAATISTRGARSRDMAPELRVIGSGRETRAFLPVDVTGATWIQDRLEASVEDFRRNGSLTERSGLLLGAYDLGHGRRPFVGMRDFITDLKELDGRNYVMPGSRSDRDGKPTASFVHTARFDVDQFKLCDNEVPTALDVCPAGKLRRYSVAIVGKSLELLSSTEVLHLSAVRSPSGPLLVLSVTTSDGGSEFRIGLPVSERRFTPPYWGTSLAETTFVSAAGLADISPMSFETRINDAIGFGGAFAGLPNSYILYKALMPGPHCLIEGEAVPSGVAGIWQGQLRSRSDQGLCYAGPVHVAQTGEIAVVLGMQGSSLMGRWLVSFE